MKIDYCLMSCNDNPLYLDFWPFVSKIWKVRFNITPILVYIGESPPDKHYGEVIHHPPIKNIPIGAESLPSQWARYFYTSKFPDDTCIISDIDMFPISKKYFQYQLNPISDNEHIHLYPIPNRPMICTMYHVAKGSIFKTNFNSPNTFEESMDQIFEFGKNIYNRDNSYWYVDEWYATYLLKNRPIHYLERTVYARLDRSDWKYTEKEVKNGVYIDCHCIRPYKDHKEDVHKIVELICEV